MRTWRRIGIVMGLAGSMAMGGAGCVQRPDTAVRGYRSAPPEAPHAAAPEQGAKPYRIPLRSNTPQGRELCDQLILNSDGMLSDAQIRDNRHLYVVLGPKADVERAPALVRALVLIMHRRFPKEDVTVHVRDRAGSQVVDATVDLSQGTVTYEFPR